MTHLNRRLMLAGAAAAIPSLAQAAEPLLGTPRSVISQLPREFGPKRDHLFMTATQSIYMLRVNIQGAAPG